MSKYTLKNEATSDRAELTIYGDIIDDKTASIYDLYGFDGGVGPSDFKAKLDAVGNKPLDVYISSDGGDVPSGLAIANMLARRQAETVAYIDGWAASIAGIIFLACKNRYMASNTFLMLHQPMVMGFSGNIDDLERLRQWLKTTTDDSLAFIIDRLRNPTKDKDVVSDNYKAEHWYGAEEAAQYFDINVTDDCSIRAVASCKSYKVPAQLKDMLDKNEAIRKKVAAMQHDAMVAKAKEALKGAYDVLYK